jgi:hypothetical protein
MGHTLHQNTCVTMARQIIEKVNSRLALDPEIRKMGLSEARFDIEESQGKDRFEFSFTAWFNIAYKDSDSPDGLKVIKKSITVELEIFQKSDSYYFSFGDNEYPQFELETHFDGLSICEPDYDLDIKAILLKRLYASDFD